MSTPLSPKVLRVLAVLLLAAIVIAVWILLTAGQVSTDDAFIERDVVHLAPRVSGRLIEVAVEDFARVNAGDLIAHIDPAPYEARLAAAEAALAGALARRDLFAAQWEARKGQAEAALAVAEAELERQQRSLARVDTERDQAQRDLRRYQQLAEQDQVSVQTLDQAATRLKSLEAEYRVVQGGIAVARARIDAAEAEQRQVAAEAAQQSVLEAAAEQARAARDEAALALAWTRIEAPRDGVIGRVRRPIGSQVSSQTPLTVLVSGKPWVEANFKETQLEGMDIGDRVEIEVDAFPDTLLTGHVAAFQPGTGSRFAVLPPENATGNFVKVVQRLPVKIVLDEVPEELQLWPGMSAVPTVFLSEPAPGS